MNSYKHYPVYIKRFNNIALLRNSISNFMANFAGEPCAIEDVGGYDEIEQYSKLNAAILAKRRRKYSMHGDEKANYLAFAFSKVKVYAILSFDSDTYSPNKIIPDCFGVNEIVALDLSDEAKEPSFNAVNYFKNLLPGEGESPAVVNQDIAYLRVDIKESETYYLPDEVAASVSSYIELPGSYLKADLIMALGKLVSDTQRIDKMYISDYHIGGRIGLVPIIYNKNDNNQYEKIASELKIMDKKDSVSPEQLALAIGYDFDAYSVLGFEYFHDHIFDEVLKSVGTTKVYEIPAYIDSKAVLTVRCDLIRDHISFTYEYDRGVFEGMNIAPIHDCFAYILGKIVTLKNESINPDYGKLSIESRGKMEGKRAVIANTLKKLNIFHEYSDKQLYELASSIKVHHFNMQENVIMRGSHAKGLFVPLIGKIEMCDCDKDMYYRPLMILKEGDIFGVESLLANSNGRFTYKIVSTDAIVAYIDEHIFKMEAEEHKELMQYLLEVQTERMVKFAKLWMLS